MRKVLITSGGTKVPIDRVRHIANMSSGTFGSKIALESLKAGFRTDFFYAKNSKTPFTFKANLMEGGVTEYLNSMVELELMKDNIRKYADNYTESTYEDFDTYNIFLRDRILEEKPNIIVLAAAVSDYGVENYVDGKIRSRNESDMTIKLKPLPKIISKVREWQPDAYIVGFKLLVDSTREELIEASMKSIKDNDCDMIVANDLRDIKKNSHKLIILQRNVKGIQTFDFSYNGDPNYLAACVVNRFGAGYSRTKGGLE